MMVAQAEYDSIIDILLVVVLIRAIVPKITNGCSVNNNKILLLHKLLIEI